MAPIQAEVKLALLKNCFVNIPQAVVSVLDNAKAVVQNVIIELQYKDSAPNAPGTRRSNGLGQRSIYVGWTGMASTAKPTYLVERPGRRVKEEAGVVEIDATFGRTLGLADGQKVVILLHLDPPLAHTVHIEPLTPADWEIIELHASFLESNLLFQVRALPNPSFAAPASMEAHQAHPLTIHLSPTSTANVIISSLTPPQPSTTPFAKIAPDGEVIVAPNTRRRMSPTDHASSRSIASTGRRSAGTRSGATRQRSHRQIAGPNAIFLRGVDRGLCDAAWLESEEGTGQDEPCLALWIDREILLSRILRGHDYVCVSVVKPAGIEPAIDPQQQQRIRDLESGDAGKPNRTIVAKLRPWNNSPSSTHAILSSALCSTLDAKGMVGGLVRIKAPPQQMTRTGLQALRIYPFITSKVDNEAIRFGGQTKAGRDTAANGIVELYRGKAPNKFGFLDGPITDGLILPIRENYCPVDAWEWGLIRFENRSKDGKESSKDHIRWFLGSEMKANIEVQPAIPNPLQLIKPSLISPDPLSSAPPSMIGIDSLIEGLTSHLSHGSSVLITGGWGAGKSSIAHLLGHRMRSSFFYHTSYFTCQKLMTDEVRLSIIKETLNRLFMTASWGTRLGGRALVILDDLDRLCPAQTELQTNDNGRSRQTSELVCSLVRQYCGANSGVVVLATAKSKESLNNLVVGGHVVREIVALKVPDKDGRRKVLEALSGRRHVHQSSNNGIKNPMRDPNQGSQGDDAAWMGASPHLESLDVSEDFIVDEKLDFLDLAGQTDGYMPGDLVLLVGRAKNEALIRAVKKSPDEADESSILLTKEDFDNALEDFTPASLRNVTLQSSKVTFDSIGGLHETRKILLETLQYPTTYAPIFAQCPLRLRSGLLLYGYPGCGKTLLASAVAGECGLNFISVKGPEILNKYIGASEKSVRDLFERAESARPCVLFFDEFDSIAPKRGHDSTGVTDRVVNQLLTQMDGAEGLSGVYVLAATSRPDLIDPALLRPGRLDKSLLCDMPEIDDRLDIIQSLSKKLNIAPQILQSTNGSRNLREIARRTEGYSGADLQAVIYNAHLEAIHGVLGSHSFNGSEDAKKRNDAKKPHRSLTQDIIQFRFGAEKTQDASPGLSRAQQAAEYASIIAKFDALKLARRNERHQRRRPSGQQVKNGLEGDHSKDISKREVVIEWKHVEASLATTRSSVGADERRRLERIYREFILGRNGEMPNGQGPTEVGGRSSLM